MQISAVAAEGSPPVTPLDMAANLPSGSLQEPQNTGPIAPASNGLDGDSSGLRDEDQSARHVAAQDIVPDKLPDIPAAQTDEPQMPATLPSALPLSLGGVAGLSCAGLVLLKKWRFAR